MGAISAAEMANTVSAYALILAGLASLLLALLMGRQPGRWVAVYAAVLATAVATVWYHGFGETFAAGVADIGTNLLVAWLLLVAVLGDYYEPRARWWVGGALAIADLVYMVWKVAGGPSQSRVYAISWEGFGGFHIGEALLIGNSVLAVVAMYVRLRRIPARARSLWYAVTGTFLLGMVLATASNQQVDYRILAYHASWHIVASFGFVLLWAINHARFSTPLPNPSG